jgi:hypothetical protein
MATHVFSSEELNASLNAHAFSAIGTYTQESRGVNAQSLLNELVKPVRKPYETLIKFKPVPATPSMRDQASLAGCNPWQIFLLPGGNVDLAMPLELRGDVVLGCNADSDADVDVNLESFGGYSRGVSRRHLMLRPTRTRLYAIDLKSTNGTWINGMPTSQAHVLKDGDLLTLGQLHLQIRIMQQPGPSIPH